MKKLFRNVVSVLGLLLAIIALANAAQLKEARVTQVVSDVKLLPQQAAPRPAVVNDLVRSDTAVRTGTQSRSELTFSDLTITRLGANTIFSFEKGTRTMDLRDGAVLFQVPKGSGGATIRTTAVTAAITGTTGIGEFHPATANHPQPFSKWLCLEGIFRLILPNGQSVEVGPGKMVTTDGETFSPVVTFDIALVMKTSLLVNGFDTPLASLPLILVEAGRQLEFVSLGSGSNLFSLLDPANIIDVIDQGMAAQSSPSATVSPTPPITPTPSTPTPTPSTPTPTPSTPTPTPSTPTPTPGKFGVLTTIASSDPYVITGDTEISTDPTITTNGHTDFGKIYRNLAQDGQLSAFLFGSTSAFDTASGFEASLNGPAMGGAAFKFTSLQLTGNPTISTAGGGALDLGLIGVNGITSGGPGGVLTFAGIEGLLLATQNGSITLGSEISFSGLNSLTFYARGAGSILTVACDVTTTRKIRLYSEGAIELSSHLSTQELIAFSGGDLDITSDSLGAITISLRTLHDLSWSGGTNLGNAQISDANVTISADGALRFTGSLDLQRVSIGRSSGLNFSFDAGSELSFVDLFLVTDASQGLSDLDTGAIISLTAGAEITGGSLSLRTASNDGGHIGTGGNIFVSAGIDLTASSITSEILNFNGGAIDFGGDITFDITGDVNSDDLTLLINNSNQGQIGSGGNISFTTGGDLNVASIDSQIHNRDGGSIDSGGNMIFNVGGAFAIADNATFIISNRNDGGGGGTIGSDVVLTLNAASMSVGGGLITDISTNAGGSAPNVTANFDITGDLSVHEVAILDIQNTGFNNGGFVAGATIGTDAVINFNVGNVFIGGLFHIEIRDNGDSQIGRDARVSINVDNDIEALGDVYFDIVNDNSRGAPAGFIGRDASIILAADNIFSAGLLEFDLLNDGGGHIGRNAIVDLDVTGDLVAQTDLTFNLSNVGGAIDGNATLTFNTGGDLSAATLDAEINDRDGGAIGSFAHLTANTLGALTTDGDATFGISTRNDGSGGGTIGADALVDIEANSMSIGGFLTAFLSANAGGHIGTQALIQFVLPGALHSDAGLYFDLEATAYNTFGGPFVAPGVIGSDALIDVTAGSMTSDGFIEADLFDRAGHIGRDALITFVSGADITAQDDVIFFLGTADDPEGTPGTVGRDAAINITAANLSSTASELFAQIRNHRGGSIGRNASILFDLSGALTSLTDMTFQITNFDDGDGNGGGSIGGNAAITVNAASLSANSLFANIDNIGGLIGSDASIAFSVTGALTKTAGDADFQIDNGSIPGRNPGAESIDGGITVGSIIGDATISVIAGSISADNLSMDINNAGGGIGGNATLALGASAVSASFFAEIENQFFGTIGSGAEIDVKVGSITPNAPGALVGLTIANFDNGSIGESANINFGAGGDVSAPGQIAFAILNNDIFEDGGGSIGSDATIDVTGDNFSSGGVLFAQINNDGGDIGGDAIINFAAGDIESTDETSFVISNISGAIGGNASISVNAANITADSLIAQIDNSNGEIGANATIDSTLSGTANITSDATFEIDGSDNALDAAINFNGGSYDAGANFRAFIDGNGTIAFNNASIHADVLKAGVFGTNGVLNIGGGTLSADTTLKLYAPGSNGQINFISNVTLGGDSAKIIAADSVTIFNGVVVTVGNIADENPADVFTNNANYSVDFGGNGSTTGTFAGSGANNPQPLDSAPPFDEVRPAPHPRPHVTARTPHTTPRTHAGSPHRPNVDARIANRRTGSVVRVNNSDQLLSLLDRTTPGPNGRITVPPSNGRSGPGRTHAGSGANVNNRVLNNTRTPSYPPNRLP